MTIFTNVETDLLERNIRASKEALLVMDELTSSWRKFPKPMSSTHEGYAVLLEEVEEMWDAIKANDLEHARKEAIQVAAMAIRFLVET